MKIILPSIIAFVLSVSAYSQTIIEKPKTGMSTTENIKIMKIEMTDSTTVLYFHTTYAPNNWIFIPKETFIQPVGSDKKLFITAALGIPKNEKFWMPASGMVDYQLIFPKIDRSVSSIDYGEANGGGWNIYDIQLKKTRKSLIPEELTGNWFNAGNGLWELSLLDSTAIFKSQVWKYGKIENKIGESTVALKKGDRELTLRIKKDKDDGVLVAASSGKFIRYCHNVTKTVHHETGKPFHSPVLKMDTAIISGYIASFSPRSGIKTFSIFVNNVLTGSQDKIVVDIAIDGEFMAKVPLYCQSSVVVASGIFNGPVFLEPGKKTFLLIESGEQLYIMGDCARINNDLALLHKVSRVEKNDLADKILELSSEKYKAYCNDLLQRDLDSIKAYQKKYNLSDDAVQIISLEEKFFYASKLLKYNYDFINANSKNNNIPQAQRSLPVNKEELSPDFYSFINNEMVDDTRALMTEQYFSFIQNLKYSDVLRKNNSVTPLVGEIVDAIRDSGYSFTTNERTMVDAMKETDTPETRAFQNKYGMQINGLYMKYIDYLRPMLLEKQGNVLFGDVEKLLVEKGVTLTDDDNKLIKVCIEQENKESSVKIRQIREKYMKEYQQLLNKNTKVVSAYYNQLQKKARSEGLEMLGIHSGFLTDVLQAQDACRTIVTEITPLTDQELTMVQQLILTPFIADYIKICNNQVQAKIEVNKKLKGWIYNEVPKVEKEQLLDAILAKYKGKVVYVDFWATWCGPCRAGIEQIKPLKDEMTNENMVFVYLTGETSPESTYKNMIPSIKGEHYRLSGDQWNYLCGKFNISGIPHYMLVGKDGNIINPCLGHMGNDALKSLLLKYIQE